MGRETELARAEAMLSHEAMCLVYGVAGIGKSEFLYALIERLWVRAPGPVILLRCGDDAGAFGWLDALADRLGLPKDRKLARPSQLQRVAKALEHHKVRVVIDELDASDLTLSVEALGFFARHLRAARIIGASRLELTFPPPQPQPVLVRLKPFDEESTNRLVALLAERAGLPLPVPGQVFASTCGEPLAIVRATLGVLETTPHCEDALSTTLLSLNDDEMRVLGALSVAGGPVAYREGLEYLGPNAHDVITELRRRLLVERTADGVWLSAEPLVKERALEVVTDHVLAAARRAVARMRMGHFEHRPDHAWPEAIEAARQLALAEDLDESEQIAQRIYRRVSANGLDLRLVPVWSALDRAREQRVASVELLRARTALRHGDVNDAREHVEAAEREGAVGARPWLVHANIHLRALELDEAATALARAQKLARDSTERVSVALLEATSRGMTGAIAAAQGALACAEREAAPPSAREWARIELVRARLCWLDGQPAEARRVTEHARVAHATRRGADLGAELALMGLFTCLELGDVAAARALYDSELSALGEAGQLRAREISILHAALLAEEGQLDKAIDHLTKARTFAERTGAMWDLTLCDLWLARALGREGDSERAELTRARAIRLLEGRGAIALRDRLFSSARMAPSLGSATDLVIDLVRAEIRCSSGRAITGRHQACEILACLVAANGRVVSAEALYAGVWGGRNYHPLRHRNAIYVAINRLRRALTELRPARPRAARQSRTGVLT